MPAPVVLVHNDIDFLEAAIGTISRGGYEVAGFSDPIEALDALGEAERVELLITLADFGPGKQNGVSLARMTRLRRRHVRLLFICTPEHLETVSQVGEVVMVPLTAEMLAREVDRVFSAPPGKPGGSDSSPEKST